jgi:hypothetical protein
MIVPVVAILLLGLEFVALVVVAVLFTLKSHFIVSDHERRSRR